MSRLGKSPITLPKNVVIEMNDGKIHVKGPKGVLDWKFPVGLCIKLDQNILSLHLEENAKVSGRLYGLARATVNNMIVGVSQGFEKKLLMVGVGYRALLQGELIALQIGFSHPTELSIPSGVSVVVEKNTTIIVRGIDRQLVGEFAAKIRSKRPPEPYKGKGIRYENEVVRKKAGKAAKGKAG
jgi:large subunit ribosomal protein L6